MLGRPRSLAGRARLRLATGGAAAPILLPAAAVADGSGAGHRSGYSSAAPFVQPDPARQARADFPSRNDGVTIAASRRGQVFVPAGCQRFGSAARRPAIGREHHPTLPPQGRQEVKSRRHASRTSAVDFRLRAAPGRGGGPLQGIAWSRPGRPAHRAYCGQRLTGLPRRQLAHQRQSPTGGAMAATSAARPLRPAAIPARRAVLRFIPRRDAAQRLSLAYGLLARAAQTDRAGAGGAAPGAPAQPQSREVLPS